MTRSRIAYLALAIALASLAVQAERYFTTIGEPAAGDLSMDAPNPSDPAIERALQSVKPLPNDYGVSYDDVFDADSFGRPVRWLGLHSDYIAFAPTCPRVGAPAGELCHAFGTNTAAASNFNITLRRELKLPPRAATSMLCQWATPIVDVTYQNNLSVRRNGTFWYRPWVVIRSEVLNEVINPATGLPYGGKLRLDMWPNVMGRSIEPGATWRESSRWSQTCIGGLVNRRTLMVSYGFSEDQVARFFESPIQLEFGVSGGMQHVSALIFSMNHRILGD
jgi:hypothetical protein